MNDKLCIWIVGRDFEPDSYIDLRDPGSNEILSQYKAENRSLVKNESGTYTMKIRLKTNKEKDLFTRKGLNIWVVNPKSSKWTSPVLVKK